MDKVDPWMSHPFTPTEMAEKSTIITSDSLQIWKSTEDPVGSLLQSSDANANYSQWSNSGRVSKNHLKKYFCHHQHVPKKRKIYNACCKTLSVLLYIEVYWRKILQQFWTLQFVGFFRAINFVITTAEL